MSSFFIWIIEWLKENVREAENLLTPEVIKQVICSYEGEGVEIHDFSQSSYASKYLGRFIDSSVLADKTKSRRFGKRQTCCEDKSGTVKNKVEFCRRALTHVNSLSDLSEEAMKFAEKICGFVVQENA